MPLRTPLIVRPAIFEDGDVEFDVLLRTPLMVPPALPDLLVAWRAAAVLLLLLLPPDLTPLMEPPALLLPLDLTPLMVPPALPDLLVAWRADCIDACCDLVGGAGIMLRSPFVVVAALAWA